MAEFEDVAAVAPSTYATPDRPSVASTLASYRFVLALAGLGTPVLLYVGFALTWSFAARDGGVANSDNSFAFAPVALFVLEVLSTPVLVLTVLVGMFTAHRSRSHWLTRTIITVVNVAVVGLVFYEFMPNSGVGDGFPNDQKTAVVAIAAGILVILPTVALLLHGPERRTAALSRVVTLVASALVLAAVVAVIVSVITHPTGPFWWTNVQ